MPAGITVLHLSDIHRTPDEPVSTDNICAALVADLHRQQDQEGLPQPDLLVISGDLTQSGQQEEYDEAYTLIDQLRAELSVPGWDRVILVPGNHDVNWDLSAGVFRSGRRAPAGIDPALVHSEGSLCFWTDEETYAQRLAEFSAFYRRVYGRDYGIQRRDQFDTWLHADMGLCLVGLNSCDRVDHLRFGGAICEEALHAAERRLQETPAAELARCTKIAVWHHDLNWLGTSEHQDGLEPSILGHMVDAGYDLTLCGHTHRTNVSAYSYPGFRLPIVTAGSVCAGPRQREESIPRLYNLIHIEGSIARVHTRSRETKDTPWRPEARWGTPPQSYFHVPLARSHAADETPAAPDHAAKPRDVLIPNEYYVKLIRDFEYLDIAGIDTEKAIPLKLSETYVKLRVIADEQAQAGADQGGMEPEEPGSFDIHTALQRYPQLVIVGDPGSGKSTFLKFIALALSRAQVEHNPRLAEELLGLTAPLPVPVFVSLWDLSDHVTGGDAPNRDLIVAYLVESFASFGVPLTQSEVETLLARGRCCLLFDGLDEVPTDEGRAIVSRLVERFVDTYGDNRYVLTSRIRGYTGGAILRGDFRRCDIQEFDDEEIRSFARNWICSLLSISAEEVDRPGTRAQREVRQLFEAVTHPRVRPLAKNPLLMTVIAIVQWNRKRLPGQRVVLYDECVDVLLGQRKAAEQVQKVARWKELADRVKGKEREYDLIWARKRFAEMALSIMQQEKEEEITKQRIIDVLVAPFRRKRDGCPEEEARIEAELFLDLQELRSGLLVSRRARSYRFVHLTFQEYLAAWHLSGDPDYWALVQPHLREQKWFETLQLLGGEFAQTGDVQLSRYVDDLLTQQGELIASRAPIIALCANIVRDAREVADLHAETRQRFEAALSSTMGVFDPRARVPEKTQSEVLVALAGLGAAVKDQLISATRSQNRAVRSQAVKLLCPHLPEDDLFAMTHIFEDKSRETINAYLGALRERNEARTRQLLGALEQPPAKLASAAAEMELLSSLPSLDRVLAWFGAAEKPASLAHAYWAEIGRRVDLVDTEGLFSAILRILDKIGKHGWYVPGGHSVMTGCIQQAIERDESRLRALLRDSKYHQPPILAVVAELSRFDLLDDDTLFSVVLAPAIRRYVEAYSQAAIQRDKDRYRALLRDRANWQMPVLESLVSLSHLDLVDDDILLPMLLALANAQILGFPTRVWRAWETFWGMAPGDIPDTVGALLAEAYRRSPDAALALLRDPGPSAPLLLATPDLARMLRLGLSELDPRGLLAARKACALDLVARLPDETIVWVFLQRDWSQISFWTIGPRGGRFFRDPVVKEKFAGIARQLVALGRAGVATEGWLQWSLGNIPEADAWG